MPRYLAFLRALAIAVLLWSGSSGAQNPAAMVTVDLRKIDLVSSGCKANLSAGEPQITWMDEDHAALLLYVKACTASRGHSSDALLLVFDKAGRLLKAKRRDRVFTIRTGPHGMLAAVGPDGIELLDPQLEVQDTLPCPMHLPSCGLTLTPTAEDASLFAVCSRRLDNPPVKLCDTYAGWPARLVASSSTGIGEVSMTSYGSGWDQAWQVDLRERWFFKNGQLESDRPGSPPIVASGDLLGKAGVYGRECQGSLSFGPAPKRFLAVCNNVRFYTDHSWDWLFTTSSIAVLDVPSRAVLLRMALPRYAVAALSTAGDTVAVLTEYKYEVFALTAHSETPAATLH